jgi:hypothetical protein
MKDEIEFKEIELGSYIGRDDRCSKCGKYFEIGQEVYQFTQGKVFTDGNIPHNDLNEPQLAITNEVTGIKHLECPE